MPSITDLLSLHLLPDEILGWLRALVPQDFYAHAVPVRQTVLIAKVNGPG